MESITKQLVNIGHGMSREIAADEPAVAKLLVELSSALDVQYERGNALEAKCAALAAEKRIAELEAREVKIPELKMLSDYLREVTLREREDIILGVKLEFHRNLKAAGITVKGDSE